MNSRINDVVRLFTLHQALLFEAVLGCLSQSISSVRYAFLCHDDILQISVTCYYAIGNGIVTDGGKVTSSTFYL